MNRSLFVTTVIGLALPVAQAGAATLVGFDFSGNASDPAQNATTATATTVDPSVIAGTLTRGAGAQPFNNYHDIAGTFGLYPNGNNFFSVTLAGAETNSNYVQFTVAPTAGNSVSVSSLTTNVQLFGQSTFSAQFEYSTDGSTFTAIPGVITNTGSVDTTGVASLQNAASTLYLREYLLDPSGPHAYYKGAIGNGTSNAGNDIAVIGTVTAAPEPASLSALALGAVGLLSRRRRNA